MPEATEKRHLWQSPLAMFFVALALRLLGVRLFYNSTWNDYQDHLLFGFETGRIARSIVEGRGFGNPISVPSGPTAWLTPVYPYLLAGVFKLCGVFTKTSALVILSCNSLFSALVLLPAVLHGEAQRRRQRSGHRLLDLGALSLFRLYSRRLCVGHVPRRTARGNAFSLRLEAQRKARLFMEPARLWPARRIHRASHCLGARGLGHLSPVANFANPANVANLCDFAGS